MKIALKECYEAEYWLEILFKVNAIDETTIKAVFSQVIKNDKFLNKITEKHPKKCTVGTYTYASYRMPDSYPQWR